MGGGGAMRAAAKLAGIGIVNGGLRCVPEVSPAEIPVAAVAGRVTRPVSAIVSSSDEVNSSVLTTSQNNMILQSVDPMPRLIFGGVPTLQEAKEATAELKDALEKVYLSSSKSTGCEDSYLAGHKSALSLLSKPEYLETEACVISETSATSVPKSAFKAFRLLKESPAVQNVVASIASDQNVLSAVLQNEQVVEFLQSAAPFSATDPVMKVTVADAEFIDHKSPKKTDYPSDSGQSADTGNGFKDYLQSVQTKVVEMVSSLSDYFQNLFGGPTAAEKVSSDAEGSASATTFVERTLGASLLGLAIMVIMLVVLKRV